MVINVVTPATRASTVLFRDNTREETLLVKLKHQADIIKPLHKLLSGI